MAALGGIASVEALDLITPYLDDAATKEEAGSGAVDISDKLLQGKESAKSPPASNRWRRWPKHRQPDLAKRAKDLRDQAKNKASGK